MTSVDLSTSYLGHVLKNPFVVGACPLTGDLDTVRRLEDAGAAAFVLPSLFEEELIAEQMGAQTQWEYHAAWHHEPGSYPAVPVAARLGLEEHLDHLSRVKEAVGAPVIGSLNSITLGGWLEYSRLLVEAGADALELNIYDLRTSAEDSAGDVERRLLEMVGEVRRVVGVPVAVKLSPFYTSLPHFAAELETAGADGLVLFNRFYQPDIDVEELEVVNTIRLSDSRELGLRLTWLSIFSGRLNVSLAVTGGVHTELDAVKSVMCGAHAIQVVSALLRHGPAWLTEVRFGLARWMEEHEYSTLEQLEGCMNLLCCPDPSTYQRVNYLQVLRSWKERGLAPGSSAPP